MADRAFGSPSVSVPHPGSVPHRRGGARPPRAMVVVALVAATFGTWSGAAMAAPHVPAAPSMVETAETVPLDENDFIPDSQPIGNCQGMLERPNCGSSARGGPAQTALFLTLLGGLTFIGWRIYAASRRSAHRQHRGPSA